MESTRARSFAKHKKAVLIILTVAFAIVIASLYWVQQRTWLNQITLEVQCSSAPLMGTSIPTRGALLLQTTDGKERLIRTKDWTSPTAKPFSRLRFDFPIGTYHQAIFFPDPSLQEVEIIGVSLLPHGPAKPTDVSLDRVQAQQSFTESTRTQESVTFKRPSGADILAIHIRIADVLEQANFSGSPPYLGTSLVFFAALLASYWCGRWLFTGSVGLREISPNESLPKPPFLRIGMTLGLVACMAVAVSENSHPDEYLHVEAARYYQHHWLPPSIDNEWIAPTFSHYGLTYLADADLGYFFAGKFLLFSGTLFPNVYIALRFFNVALFAALLLWSVRVFRGSHAILILFLTPQLWYALSAYNTEGWALFVSFLLIGQIASEDSSLQKYFAAMRFGDATRLLLPALLCSCLLLLTKKNFLLVFLFFTTWLIWQLITRRFGLRGFRGAIRILPLILLPILLRFGVQAYQGVVNNRDLPHTIQQQAEKYAQPDFKPSVLEAPGKGFEGIHMKQRGISLRDVLIRHQWLLRMMASFFGTYGWMTILSPDWFYIVMAAGWIIFLGVALVATFTALASRERVFYAIAWLHLPLIVMIALYYSWTSDFQSQGRYLFPFLPILFYLIHAVKLRPRWLFVATVWGLFLLSTYSFIFFGLRTLAQM